jgi:hypothetical protein
MAQTPIVIRTLGQAKANGYGFNATCLKCGHRRDLNMDDLIAYLGEDFVFVGDPPPLNRHLRCVECCEKRARRRSFTSSARIGSGSPISACTHKHVRFRR